MGVMGCAPLHQVQRYAYWNPAANGVHAVEANSVSIRPCYFYHCLWTFVMTVVILIDYSCNYTSRDSNGPMSGVKILHPPSDFGAPKGSHTPMTAGKCGISDPMQ